MYLILVKCMASGLLNDAKVLQAFFQSRKIASRIVLRPPFPTTPVPQECYCKIYIESIDPYFDYIKAEKQIWIPNPEMIYGLDMESSSRVDLVLCKTRYTLQKLGGSVLGRDEEVARKLVYTGFTSSVGPTRTRKDYNLAVHIAGSSWMKNSGHVLSSWLRNDGFLRHNPDLELVIIVQRNTKAKLTDAFFELVERYAPQPHRYEGLRCVRIKNVLILDQHVEEDALRKIQLSAGYHICVSEVEGFGHYINEGRAASAVTVTIDSPSMNELITDRRCLIKCGKRERHFDKYGKYVDCLYDVDVEVSDFDERDFSRKMIALLAMKASEKDTIGAANLVQFKKGKASFYQSMDQAIRLLREHGACAP